MGVHLDLIVGCTRNYGYEFFRKNKDKRSLVIVDKPEEEFSLMCGMGLLFRDILPYLDTII